MWENISGLSDGSWIEEVIRKGDLIMVFDGSCQPNLDNNRGAEAWVFTVKTQIDTCGDTYPQYNKWKIHTDHNLQAYMQYYYFCN